MKQKVITRKTTVLTILLICIAFAFLLFGANKTDGITESAVTPPILLGESEEIAIVNGKITDMFYTIYGSVPHFNPGGTAMDISDWFYKKFKADIPFEPSPKAPYKSAVVYGRIDEIDVSVRLAEEIDSRPADSLVWGIAYADGFLAIYANRLEAIESDNIYIHSLMLGLEDFIKDEKFVVTDGLFEVHEITASEYVALTKQYEDYLAAKEEEERLAKVEALKDALANEFTDLDFDPESKGMTTDMELASGKYYESPLLYPTTGQHPRLLFTAADIPNILAALENPENEVALKDFTTKYKTEYTGILPAATKHTSGRVGFHNLDYIGLQIIQSKAFAYAIYGNEIYGYEAIYAMLNYIKTLYIDSINSDQCRDWGYIMYTAACVYDWCYGLMSADDMRRMTLGVEHLLCTGSVPNEYDMILPSSWATKMEIGFPPSKQGGVSGHGSEMQLLRDYLSYSIAIYDEVPGWYEFVGGRFYQEYVTPRNTYYEAGLYPQGTSYNTHRFLCDLYSAAIMTSAVGKLPYSDNLINAVYGLYATVNDAPNNSVFRIGDIPSTTTRLADGGGKIAFIASYIFKDANLKAMATHFSAYNKFGGGNTAMSAAETILFSSSGVEANHNFLDELPLVNYYGGYIGQYITRGSWTEKTPVVLMKIQERTTANHDHAASGTFQIYYKGILTGDTGEYGGSSYGSDHCRYYLRATVSHNGLLVYNPELAETQNGLYTGGQRTGLSEASTYAAWQSSTYDTGEVSGYSHGYTNSGNMKFAYLAGDITNSYDSETAEYVGRAMLTVYTDNEKMPMIMFVFDRIDAINPEFKSTFLLQVPGTIAPEIDEDGKKVTVSNGEGKLVLQNLIGGDALVGYGGVAEDGSKLNYQINGQQISFYNGTTLKEASFWGRVEISQTTPNEKTDNFLNVIAVADDDFEVSTVAKRVTAYTDDGAAVLEGASFGDITAIFANKTKRIADKISFSSEGEGVNEYYIGGLYSGTWTVFANEKKLGTVYSTNDSGMVYFKAPAGEIVLVPGDDIRPSNSGEIRYVTNGGSFSGKVEQFYELGKEVELPTSITCGHDIFDGWYTEPNFINKVTHIPADAGEEFTVYAKWKRIFINEDYSSTTISKTAGITENGLYYASGGRTDCFFYTEDGYLVWTTKTSWPAITAGTSESNYNVSKNSAFTFEIKLSRHGNEPLSYTRFGIRDANKNEFPFFFVLANGQVVDGSKKTTLFELTEEMSTLKMVLDFENGILIYYDEDDREIYRCDIKVPAAANVSSAAEWQKKFGNEIFKWYASGDPEQSYVRIGKIFVADGNIIVPNTTPRPEKNEIVYNKDGGSFDTSPQTAYTPGESVTLDTNIAKEGFEFRGWYLDEALTEPVTELPTSAIGRFNVYAKWVAVVNYKNNANLSELKTHNMHECSNHTAENADANGVCLECGYCTEANASECPFYTKPFTAYKDVTCTKCGKTFLKAGNLGAFGANDNPIAYAKGTTTESGKTPIVMVVSSAGTQFNYPGNLYESIFNKVSGEITSNALVLEIDLGIPTEEQYLAPIEGMEFTDAPSGAKGITMGLRLGSSNAQYSPFLLYAVNGKLSFTSKAADAFATLPVGDVETYKIVLDFSEVTAGDEAQDYFKIYVYDASGELLASSTGKTKDAFDISNYTNNLAQWRVTSGGSIMYDNIKAYTTNLTAGSSPEAPPVPGAQIGKTLFDETFEGESYIKGFGMGSNNEETCSFVKENGNLVWSCKGRYTYVAMLTNSIKNSSSNIFTFTTDVAKLQDAALLKTSFIFQNEGKQSILLFCTQEGGVYSNDKKLLFEVTETLKTLNFVVNFNDCSITYYDSDFNILHKSTFTFPGSEGLSPSEIKALLRDGWDFKWQTDTDFQEIRSIVIGGIKATEGNLAIVE